MSFLLWLRTLTCAHRVYLEDLHRVSPTKVECRCHKCGKYLTGTHGLALPCSFDHRDYP